MTHVIENKHEMKCAAEIERISASLTESYSRRPDRYMRNGVCAAHAKNRHLCGQAYDKPKSRGSPTNMSLWDIWNVINKLAFNFRRNLGWLW